MAGLRRREVLKQAVGSGLAAATAFIPRRAARAQPASAPAQVYVDPVRTVADLDRKLFGSFLEHIGRAIYQGIFEPGSKLADKDGFRRDVLEEIRRLNVPIVRYPGGNFVSGYNWLDGVGPRRPRLLERAWNSIESNAFGTNEFLAWCRRVETEPLLAVNLGTGTPESAAALVEYCNVAQGTRYSDLRREHGIAEPHGVKYWCLGNEMDGPWQIGHMSAVDYGRKAADAARQMRRIADRGIQLVACGSTAPMMPTYLEWDRQMLEQCYQVVDAISLHRYVGNNAEDSAGKTERFLAINLAFEQQVDEVAGVCDATRARLKSRKRLWLCFDEWNVWYRNREGDGKQQEAPHLIEEVYNLEDALAVGGILNSLMRKAARVRIACLAQLVNVIAPLLTNSEKVLRQSIYFPYAWALQYARGKVLDLGVTSATYDAPGQEAIPYIDAAGTLDPDAGLISLFFLNRDLEREREVTLVWRDALPVKVTVAQVLTGSDLKAANSFDAPGRVAPRELEAPRLAPRTTIKLPAQSYSVVQLALR
ncbi:MAG: alpha-N-arabinofuranosidase [Planctomycetaceae bacterium]